MEEEVVSSAPTLLKGVGRPCFAYNSLSWSLELASSDYWQKQTYTDTQREKEVLQAYWLDLPVFSHAVTPL